MVSVVIVLYLVTVFWAVTFQYAISSHSVKKSRNHILFERFECISHPKNKILTMECDVRRVSQHDMKIYIRANFSEPMKSIWIHGVFNYKYNINSYQKFPIDLWEDLCSWLRGEKSSYFLKWTADNVRNYSNMNHSCPYSETTWIDIKRIPINRLFVLEPFMPSGRYRVDLNISRGYKEPALIMTKFYFGISDSRIEQF